MAADTEMRNLALHAADLLEACNPMRNAEAITVGGDTARDARRRATAEVVAITTAETVLRMLAACMAVEAEPAREDVTHG